MGRFIDLCAEVAVAADEGPEGLVLPPEAWDKFRENFSDEDIEDAMKIVQEQFLQNELVDAADTLSAHLVEVLGKLGGARAFAAAQAAGANLSLDVTDQIVRRVARLEELLTAFRDGAPPDSRGFDELQRRLLDRGIEAEMESDDEAQ
jgi:uncharacterized protein with von Willebrand factor type A (vWA) domain